MRHSTQVSQELQLVRGRANSPILIILNQLSLLPQVVYGAQGQGITTESYVLLSYTQLTSSGLGILCCPGKVQGPMLVRGRPSSTALMTWWPNCHTWRGLRRRGITSLPVPLHGRGIVGPVLLVGQAWQQELEVASHITSTARKQREMNNEYWC